MTKRSASSGSRRSTTSTPAKKKPAAKGRPASRSRGASKRKPSEPLIKLTPDQKLDLLGGFLIFFALLTLLSLLSAQQGTLTGIWISFLSLLFGWGMYVVPVFIGAVGLWLILRRFEDRIPWPETEQLVGIMLGFFVALMTMHMVVHLLEPQVDLYALQDELPGGGLVGAVMLDAGLDALGPAGVTITLVLAWLVVGTFTAGISPADIIERLVEGPKAPVINTTANQRTQLPLPDESLRVTGPLEGEDEDWDGPVDWDSSPEEVSPLQKSRRGRKQKEDVGQGSPDEVKIHVASRSANGKADRNGSLDNLNIRDPNLSSASSQIWRLPVIGDILKPGSEQTYSEDLIRKQVHIIENTLESLGAPVRVREINQGPVITQFGAEPLFLTNRSGKTTKVKVSKIANLADDLALALSARSIRIEAPIPGKGLVGIEVPNEEPAVVSLLDTMESERFAKLKGRLRIGLGQDVSGQAVAADLRLMPHLLIAGATGAGKSVCVNAVIAALLLQNTPDTLRLLMVDPKRVELTQYNGIPHLLSPVIVDVERVVPALKWVLREMDGRYRRFAQIGARNIEDFNRRVTKMKIESPIPYIIVLIDELADMMMQAPEDTERVVCRLAQMARATGIHLIIATQRPSVDVVTGLIKANFPARVAFAVTSSIDSRVILDTPGAERLLGRGDMLFMPPDVSQPLRLQGAYVTEPELEHLISYWRNAVDPGSAPQQVVLPPAPPVSLGSELDMDQPKLFPEFDDSVTEERDLEDVLLPTAISIFLEEDRASVSLLQRRLRIGYTRSARLVEELSDMGIVTGEKKGQSQGVNRKAAERFLESLEAEA